MLQELVAFRGDVAWLTQTAESHHVLHVVSFAFEIQSQRGQSGQSAQALYVALNSGISCTNLEVLEAGQARQRRQALLVIYRN